MFFRLYLVCSMASAIALPSTLIAQESLPVPPPNLAPNIQLGHTAGRQPAYVPGHFPQRHCGGHPCTPFPAGMSCTGHFHPHTTCEPHYSFGSCIQKHHEYFQYSYSPPCLGERVYRTLGAQVENGRLAQLVFFNIHFAWNVHSQSWQLSEAGWRHLHTVAQLWSITPGTITVQQTGNPNIDSSRTQIVLTALGQFGVNVGPNDIVLSRTWERGIGGVEATLIYENTLLPSPYQASGTFGQSVGNLFGPASNVDAPGGGSGGISGALGGGSN